MPRYARLASQLLARADRSSAVVAPDAETRARAVDALAGALATRARARRLRVRTFAGLVAAAATVLVFTTLRHVHRTGAPIAATAEIVEPAQVVAYAVGGAPSVVVAGTQAALASGSTLVAGSRLVTPATGRAVLSFSTGTSVTVGEATDLAVATEGNAQVLHLDAGWIDLHVAKLAAGQRFLVESPDTEVEVHGTQFRVELAPATSAPSCAGGGRTRVRVTEGVVTVRHGGDEVRLLAGDSWPRDCAPDRVVVAGAPAPATVGALSPGSTLRDQNDLFARAVAAKRRGDTADALATLDRFLVTYPASPLLESVVVERMRVVRTTAPARALAVAKDYLARYPRGYARTEAEAIVTGGP